MTDTLLTRSTITSIAAGLPVDRLIVLLRVAESLRDEDPTSWQDLADARDRASAVMLEASARFLARKEASR